MPVPNNLPAELTSFVGRGPQLAELKRLTRKSRLVTLTGPGGAGKTRLALRLAAETLDRYPDGVWLLDLAPMRDARLLDHTLAGICGTKEDPNRSVRDALISGLATSRSLIVLDGCEHLVDTCGELASQLLLRCGKLSILTTSREPLGVAGEVIWRTPSLTTPRPEDGGRPEVLIESEAMRLFVDRVRLSRSDYQLRTPGAAAAAEVCTRLDGLPLAIELAAGVASVMTVEEILERLHHRFQLLSASGRHSPPHHHTLRQAVDWSYGLLSPTEQALFARLSVFGGGFDLAAAEAVGSGEPIGANQVLPVLSRLVHKSLVVAEPSLPGHTRYRMLDTLREYAGEKLAEIGEALWRTRHAEYFADWTTKTAELLITKDQALWIRRLDEEHANIRLSLEWSLAERSDNALRLAAAMNLDFWWMHHSLGEGFEWLSRALELENSTPDLRLRALVARARLARQRGDYATAQRDAEEAAGIADVLRLNHYLAVAVNMLGIIASESGDLETAVGLFSRATDLAEKSGDRDRLVAGLNNLAILESELGQLDAASAHIERSLSLLEDASDRFGIAGGLATAAWIDVMLGQIDRERRRYAEALSLFLELRDTINLAQCLDGVAAIAMQAGDASRTAILISAGQALRAITGGAPGRIWAAKVDDALEWARARLGRASAEAAMRRGAKMSMEEAVRFALGEKAPERRDGRTVLTGREIQVARLIAEGMTNGEVAAKLRISGRTADAHVEHIRNKLGLRTRAQIAIWAHERLEIA